MRKRVFKRFQFQCRLDTATHTIYSLMNSTVPHPGLTRKSKFTGIVNVTIDRLCIQNRKIEKIPARSNCAAIISRKLTSDVSAKLMHGVCQDLPHSSCEA